MPSLLEIGRQDRVLWISLNRPEKRNALSAALCRELADTLEKAGQDPSLGAILLTGNGKSFCAGMDLGEIGAASSEELNQVHERLFTVGFRLGVPLVAAVHGAALGGGTGLVANCHIVVADEHATFGLTEIRLGLWPFLVYRAVSAVLGDRRTLELALTGRILGAREAREMGLVHEVAADLESRAAEIAAGVASASPSAIRTGLWFAHETRGRDWREAGEIGRQVREDLFRSADLQEGIRAFLEKRKPKWPSLS